ncbi:hypothetical protein, partial [Escherichia coli]|uniref:hypothetical protein n=1 Tax=Escherichia coli TaxID=562 RepID=UPI0018D5559E
MTIMTIETLLDRDFGTIPELIHLHAQQQPGYPALVQDERSLSYAELDALMDRVAASLQGDGIQ